MLIPLHDQVLIEPEQAPKAVGRIALPDPKNFRPEFGRVVALGEGKLSPDGQRQPFRVKPGDRVAIPPYKGNEFSLDGKTLIFFREEFILAIIEE